MTAYDRMANLFIWLILAGIWVLLGAILSGNVHSDTLTVSDVKVYNDSDAVLYYPWEFGLFVGYSTEAVTVDPEYDSDGELDYLDTISGATEFVIHSEAKVDASQDVGSDDVEVYFDFRYGYSEAELLAAGWSNQFRNDYTVSNPTALDATYSIRLRLEAALYEDLLVQTRWCLRWTSEGSASETCSTSRWVVLSPFNQPTPTPTVTVAPGSTDTPTPTPSWTPTATDTPTPTDTPTNTPTATDTPVTPYTNTPTPTATNTPTPTRHIEAWYDDHRIEDPFRHDLIEWQDQNVLPETVPSPGTVLRVNNRMYMVDEEGGFQRFKFEGEDDADSEVIGDGQNTVITVSHGLGTDIIAQARDTFDDYSQNVVRMQFDDADTISYHYPSAIDEDGHTSIYQESDYHGAVGNASDTTFSVEHSLNSQNLIVQCRNYTSNDALLYAEAKITDNNNITVTFGDTYGINQAAVNIIEAATSMVIGNASDTILYVTHGYNTRNILVSVFESAGDKQQVQPQIYYDTPSRLRFVFQSAPGNGSYTVNLEPIRPITWDQLNQQFVRSDNSNIMLTDTLGHSGMNFYANAIEIDSTWDMLKSGFTHIMRMDGDLELDPTNGGRAGGHIITRNYIELPDHVGKKFDLALDVYKIDVSNNDFDLSTDKNFRFHSKDYSEVVHFDEIGNATFDGVIKDASGVLGADIAILDASIQAVESASDTFVRTDGTTDITGEQTFTNDAGMVNFNSRVVVKKSGLSNTAFDVQTGSLIIETAGLGAQDYTFSNLTLSTTNHGDSSMWYDAWTWGNHTVAGYITGNNPFSVSGAIVISGAVGDQPLMAALTVDTVTDAVIDFTSVTLADFTNDAGFLTENETITISGDASGSGKTSISISLAANSVADNEIDFGQVTLADFTNDAGFLTSNQTITLSGDVSGSGQTAITTTIGTNKVGDNEINFSEVTLADFTNDAGYFEASGDVDHGGVTGLSDDDHLQYLLVDGSRAMTGNLELYPYQANFGVGSLSAAGNNLILQATTASSQLWLRADNGATDIRIKPGVIEMSDNVDMATNDIISPNSIISSGTITLTTAGQLVFGNFAREQIVLARSSDTAKTTIMGSPNDMDFYAFNSFAWSTDTQADAMTLNTVGDLSIVGDVNVGDELQAKTGDEIVVDATFDFASGHGLEDVVSLNFTSGNSRKVRLSGESFSLGVSGGSDFDYYSSLNHKFHSASEDDAFVVFNDGDIQLGGPNVDLKTGAGSYINFATDIRFEYPTNTFIIQDFVSASSVSALQYVAVVERGGVDYYIPIYAAKSP